MIIGSIISIIAILGYFSLKNSHVLYNFYLLGITTIGILIASFPGLKDSLSYAMSDNSLGISTMLSLPEKHQKDLKQLTRIGSTSTFFFQIINIICIFTASCILMLPLMVRSVKWLYSLKLIQSNSTYIESSKLFNLVYDINNFVIPFKIHFLNPIFITGLFLGFAVLLGICSFAMVLLASRHHSHISKLLHQEFKIKPDIWDYQEFPDYMTLVRQVSKSASKQMIIAFFTYIILVTLFWCFMGISGMIGFILSQITGGLLLATFFMITGSLWSKSKKVIERNETDADSIEYISLFFCDKLGDIFKDSLAPILINTIKFTILLAIILSGVILEFNKGYFLP